MIPTFNLDLIKTSMKLFVVAMWMCIVYHNLILINALLTINNYISLNLHGNISKILNLSLRKLILVFHCNLDLLMYIYKSACNVRHTAGIYESANGSIRVE